MTLWMKAACRRVPYRTVLHYSYRIADYVLPVRITNLLLLPYYYYSIYIIDCCCNKNVNARCSCSDDVNPGSMILIEMSYRLSLVSGCFEPLNCHTGSQQRTVRSSTRLGPKDESDGSVFIDSLLMVDWDILNINNITYHIWVLVSHSISWRRRRFEPDRRVLHPKHQQQPQQLVYQS